MATQGNNTSVAGGRHYNTSGGRHGAFTLIELLIVVAIVAILTALGVMAIHSARGRSHSVACLNNLRQVALSFQLFVDSNADRFPSDDQEPWFVQIARQGNLPQGIFQCTAAPDDLPISYSWRDDLAIGDPARLSGKRVNRAASGPLVLVFDQNEGWHAPGQINAATIAGNAQTFASESFEDNLSLSVTTGQPFLTED